MQNKYVTNPIERQKILLGYKNIKIDTNSQQRTCEALQNLQKVLLEIEARKNSPKGLDKK